MRWRIAVSVAVYALLVIVAQAVAVLLMFDDKEEEFIDQILSQQIAHSMQVWRTAPEAAFPNTPDMRLYRIADDGAAGDVPEYIRALKVGNHEVHLDGHEFHIAVRADEGARYVLVYDVEEHEGRIKGLMVITLVSAVPLGLLTLLIVYGLSGRLALQLEVLAARVGSAAGGSHVQAGMERELLAIAHRLDEQEVRQAQLLERERNFTADLAHELRTPLTGIRTDAELLAALPELPEPVQRRTRRIIDSVDRIARLSDGLLLMAREATPALLEPVRVADALRASWASLPPSGKTLNLIVDMPEDRVVDADATLLGVVLRNLLDNAVRHSSDGDIRCTLIGDALVVHDCGSGFDPEALPFVFDRLYRGRGGQHGLGLALVRHVCDACGWRVSAANAAEGGASITLDFGSSARPAGPSA